MGGAENKHLTTGIADLDNLLQGLIPGDKIVWQVDDLADYAFFAEKFARSATENDLQCVYFRFARHKPILPDETRHKGCPY
jgi:hypothetical protein